MAKVMISLPDKLLTRLDRLARDRNATRSGMLRELAEQALAGADRGRAARVDSLLSEPGNFGGDAAGEVRRMRESRGRA